MRSQILAAWSSQYRHVQNARTFSDSVWHLQRGDTGDKNANAKKKWFEEKQKRKHAELEKLGLDTKELHRIETAEQAGITATL